MKSPDRSNGSSNPGEMKNSEKSTKVDIPQCLQGKYGIECGDPDNKGIQAAGLWAVYQNWVYQNSLLVQETPKKGGIALDGITPPKNKDHIIEPYEDRFQVYLLIASARKAMSEDFKKNKAN